MSSENNSASEPALVLEAGQGKTIGERTQEVIDHLDGRVKTVNCERFKNCFFFSITIRRWGNRAKVKDLGKFGDYTAQLKSERERAEAGEDGEIKQALAGLGSVEGSKTTSITKMLLHSEALDSLNDFLTSTKERLCGRFGVAMPSRIKEGLFVVPAARVEEFDATLKEAARKLREPFTHKNGEQSRGYIPEFLADYEAAISRAENDPLLKGGLGPLFVRSDYPPAEEIAGLFSIEWNWLALSVPEGLPESMRAEATEKLNRQFEEAAEQVKAALYTQFGEFLEHATEKLTVEPGEKPKVFRDSMLGNIAEFCAVFESRNIWNDQALKALVDRARGVLGGVTADKVRKFASVRENTREAFAQIKAELDKAIVTAKGRHIDLED